jgi:lysyl endopeptidase
MAVVLAPMIARLLIVLFAALEITAAAAAGMPSRPALPSAHFLAPQFRAPRLAPVDAVALPPLVRPKAAAVETPGPVRVGTVREVDSPPRIVGWTPVAGGYVAKVRVSATGALGLRTRFDLGVVPGTMEIRAQGADGRIETQVLDPTLGPEIWGPWTDGPAQVLELFTPVRPGNDDAVRIGALVHFDTSVVTKAAGTCTLETACAATDTSLDPGLAAAIAEREKSVVRMTFVEGGSSFVCSGTLINTEKFPAPFVLTANHCISSDQAARTIATRWFDVSDQGCPEQGILPSFQQVSGGMQLVFSNYNVDSTLLLMNQPPPEDALYAGWNPARLATADPIVSISHPQGDTARYAVGNISQEFRLEEWPQEFYGVRYSHGIIQGGSSGSGLFTFANGTLTLRGILTGTTVRSGTEGLSCTDLNEDGLYSRFEIFEPEIAPYITTAGRAPDDAPNRPQDFSGRPVDPGEFLEQRAAPLALDNRHIDYAGDIDIYRFQLGSSAWVSAWTEGANLDDVGTILDSAGKKVEVNDDAQTSSNHFGITKLLDPGTYYLQVAHWDAAGTGAYNLRMRADALGTNYTDLWYNAAESGWGINFNHQDDKLFATLFTYDASGAPMWLVMDGGPRQADGSFSGPLYRTTGAAFNTVPFPPPAAAQVGSLRVAFSGTDAGTLTYSYLGTTVTKAITRQSFSTAPKCGWSAFDRSFAANFQDLWFNPSEPGWGVNVAHQGDILFATLFTYDASGNGMWLVMPSGQRTAVGTYSGQLFRTRGPAFNASPWVLPANPNEAVGNMTFTFTDGNTGTLAYTVNGTSVTKSIQREVFGDLRTDCEP